MKWCRIQLESGPAYGLVEGGEVAVIDGAPLNGTRAPARGIPSLR
jgi:hypothetical protein